MTEEMPFLHDLTKLLRQLSTLGKKLWVEFRPNTSMTTKVYKRTCLVITTARHLRHGHQRNRFLEKDWLIQLSTDDVKSQSEVALETRLKEEAAKSEMLRKDNTSLEKDIVMLENDKAVLEKDKATLEKDKAAKEKDKAILDKTESILKAKIVDLSDQLRKAQSAGFQPTRGCFQVKSPSKCTE